MAVNYIIQYYYYDATNVLTVETHLIRLVHPSPAMPQLCASNYTTSEQSDNSNDTLNRVAV